MLTESGKPRYWAPGYDTWHLLLIPALAILITCLSVLRPSRHYVPPPAPPPKAAQAAPTIISSPAPGAVYTLNRWGDVEGSAEPGARLTLEYRTVLTQETPLARDVADASGRFRFHLSGFPPGSYGVRVVAELPDGRTNISIEAPFRVVAEPPSNPKSTRKKAAKPAH